jgi:rubredoxin
VSGGFFAGSWNGERDSIGAEAVLECKICWWVYDPARGDDLAQVAPGTAFRDLPDDWCCPECDGGRDGFMVVAT